MNMQNGIIQRLNDALPAIQNWIDGVLDAYVGQSRTVDRYNFDGLAKCFPNNLLARTRVVVVHTVPFPPVGQFGLPELMYLEETGFEGITYRDTYFIRSGDAPESLHFHELIHAIQWAKLGPEKFLMAYGVGLLNFSYSESPLEKMAYDLQRRFENGERPEGLVGTVETQSDEIWNNVAPSIMAAVRNT